jgi:DNA invertase Pin-like site-specific DNA recombinase
MRFEPKKSGFEGRHHKKETREFFSMSQKGVPKAEDTKNKMKLAKRGSKNPASKLDEVKVLEIIELLSQNNSINSMKKIAEKYSVSIGTIHAIKSKRIWKHVWEMYEDTQ